MISEMVVFHLEDARRIVQQLEDGVPVVSAPQFEGVPAERDYAAVTVECCPRQIDGACGAYVTVREVRADRTWGARGYRYAMLTAGRMGQRLYVAATAMGLGCCGIGALYDGEAAALLGLHGASKLLYLVAVGVVKRR